MKKIVLFLFFAFNTLYLVGQSIDVQFVESSLTNCANNQFCGTIQIQGQNGADYIGISSILFTYDPNVLGFTGDHINGVTQGMYIPENFDSTTTHPLCTSLGGIPPFKEHGFDGTNPGDFLITAVLLIPTIVGTPFSCPPINQGWVDVATICFDILDPYGNPNIQFVGTQNGQPGAGDTNFNPDNNNPLEKYDNGFFTGFSTSISTVCEACTLEIPMEAGWNLISSYCMPSNPDLKSVFENIAENTIQVKDLTNTYVPAFNFNNIGDWDITSGYQVKMVVEDTLTIIGILVDPSLTPITLNPGWNLISYLLPTQSGPFSMYQDINDNIIQMKDLAGTYIPSFNFNDMGDVLPTRGYQIKMSSNNVFHYDSLNIGNL